MDQPVDIRGDRGRHAATATCRSAQQAIAAADRCRFRFASRGASGRATCGNQPARRAAGPSPSCRVSGHCWGCRRCAPRCLGGLDQHRNDSDNDPGTGLTAGHPQDEQYQADDHCAARRSRDRPVRGLGRSPAGAGRGSVLDWSLRQLMRRSRLC